MSGYDVNDASQVGPGHLVTADGAYDQDDVYEEIAARHPDAAVTVPPRSSAVPSSTAETDVSRFERVISDGLRSRTDRPRTTEAAVAVRAFNRMLDLGCPGYVRTA